MQLDPNLLYTAMDHQQMEVIVAFTTDGKLQKYNFITLQDDKNFYPAYDAAPVMRAAIDNTYPELRRALAPLLGLINEQKMRQLNYNVDVLGFSPAEVARKFLRECSL